MSFIQVIEEFRKSAIPARLTLANVEWIEGDAAIQLLSEHAIAAVQHVTCYRTKPALRLLDKYQFAAAGGWAAWGCTIEGDLGKVAYFKPVSPRQSQKPKGFGALSKLKTIKYETPAKCPALPMLPWIDAETAAAIYQRYGATPNDGETFWQVIWRCGVPIAITEGLKKALALIAHGIPAIATRGMNLWRVTGTDDLHPIIAQFATQGRAVYICFDQDEKLKTQLGVRQQVKKLGAALTKAGCKVLIPSWDRALGKGIDDVLYGQGDNGQVWLKTTLENALTLKQYAAEGGKAAALSIIRRLSQSTYPVERSTEGEYLPELPPLHQGVVHVLSATMNSGKTTRIGADWVSEARRRGWFALVLAPLNSLGKQTTQDWDLPHIHDFGTDAEQQRLLWSTAANCGGVGMCPDSLHRLPGWVMQRPILLIMDEANQVIHHMVQGNTLGDRWSDTLDRVSEIAAHAANTGAIVLSEDGLPDRAIKFTQAISGAQSVRIFRHYKRGAVWNCCMLTGHVSGFRGRVLQAAQRGDRILYVSASQNECERLELVLSEEAPHLKVIRIDSETNQGDAFDSFFHNPDSWLKDNRPDVLILSPSAKSGVSIEGNVSIENAYFSSVWGYFPTLDTDSHMQLLGRYRPAVPRFIFVPPFIQGSGDESLHNPRSISRRLEQNAQALGNVYEVAALLDGERTDRQREIDAAVCVYLSESLAVTGAQKAIAHDALIDRLETARHSVQTIKAEKCSKAVELWRQATEAIWREDSREGAVAYIDPTIHTPEWAHDELNSLDSCRESRITAQKVLLREEFPGVMFDDPDEWYQAVCSENGAMRRGVNLQARAENLDAAKERDRGAVQSILSANIRALHRLPKHYARAMLLYRTGVLSLLDGSLYGNSDKRAIAIKTEALKWAKEISYWLRLTINDSQTPVVICNKLLKTLKLKGKAIARPGKRGEDRDRLYCVEGQGNPIRQRLLEAARRKLSESVSTTRYRDLNPQLQIMDTTQNSPLMKEWARPGALDDARETIAAADGDPETLRNLRKYIPDEIWRAIAS